MAGKSRRKKRLASVRRHKVGLNSSVATKEHAEVRQTYEPASQPSVASPSIPPPATRYPYIVTELRTIGILAGIVLLALVVLRLFLS